MTESQLIQLLKSNPVDSNQALQHLYINKKYSHPLKLLIKSRGITGTAANDLLTDTIVKFSLLVKKGRYEHQDNITGYLVHICKYLILDHFKKPKFDSVEITESNSNDLYVYTKNHWELKRAIKELLQQSTKSCKQILSAWSRGYSMREITKKLNLASEEATRKRKHICLKKLKTRVQQQPEILQLLSEFRHDY